MSKKEELAAVIEKMGNGKFTPENIMKAAKENGVPGAQDHDLKVQVTKSEEKPASISTPESDPLYKVFLADGIITESPQPAPHKFPKRDGNGLIQGLTYKYAEDGRIDWQAMFDPEYFVYPENDVTRDPFLKVDGLRDLAEVRGVTKKEVKFLAASESMVVVSVKMWFMPNVEDPEGRVWESLADATPANIGGKQGFQKYLSTIAETRATGRCIREALCIRLCTFEEVSKDDLNIDESANKPISDETIVAIKRQMSLKGVNEHDIIEGAEKKYGINSLNRFTAKMGKDLLSHLNGLENKKAV